MNVAYPAVVLFILALPGFIFRQRFNRDDPLYEFASITDEIIKSVLVAPLFHFILIVLNYLLVWYAPEYWPQVSLNFALMHASGNFGYQGTELTHALDSVSNHWPYIFLYFFSINTFAYWSASYFAQHFRKLDQYDHDSEPNWFYDWLINNHETKYKRYDRWKSLLFAEDEVSTITMVIEFGKSPFILGGTLADIDWGPDGNPEKLYLYDAMRRPILDTDKNESEKKEDGKSKSKNEGFYYIKGHVLIVNYSDIKTLNVVPFDMNTNKSQSIQQNEIKNFPSESFET
jgi:hypothetical protein